MVIFIIGLSVSLQAQVNNYTISDISIAGNDVTQDEYILKKLTFYRGEEFDSISEIKKYIEASTQNLYNTRLFYFVNISYIFDNSGNIDILVYLCERSYKMILLFPSLDFYSEFPFDFVVWYQNMNFNGNGAYYDFSSTLGYSRFSISGSYYAPNFLNTGFYLYAYFSYDSYDKKIYEYDYWTGLPIATIYESSIQEMDLYLNLLKPLNGNSNFYIDLYFNYNNYNTIINLHDFSENEINIFSIGLGFIFGNVDYLNAWKDGYIFKSWIGISPLSIEQLENMINLTFMYYKSFDNFMFWLRIEGMNFHSEDKSLQLNMTDVRGIDYSLFTGNFTVFANMEFFIKFLKNNENMFIEIFLDSVILSEDLFSFTDFRNNEVIGIGIYLNYAKIYYSYGCGITFNISKYLNNEDGMSFYIYIGEYF